MKRILTCIMIVIITFILYFSISFLHEKKTEEGSKIYDVTRVVEIGNNKLKVKFINGNMIDEKLTYGNLLTKELEIMNDTEEEITYSITFKEVHISNETLTYSLSASLDKKSYTQVNKDESLLKDMHLGYNLKIDPQTKLYIKIEFKANYEEDGTSLKGILNVENNLSEGDLFLSSTKKIVEEIESKIGSLNGIVESGYYLVNLKELSSEIYEKYKGYIIVDAYNISEIKYIFFTYSDSYMLKNYIYKVDSNKSVIKTKDDEITKLNDSSVCDLYTKRECKLFSTLKYNKLDNRDDFYKETKRVIDLVKNNFDNSNVNMIYDITRDIDSKAKVRGFILVNNDNQEEPNYYIYLTNDIYMISGYNMTKNGDYNASSSTIREYKESAFNLAAKDIKTVCSFSGFKNCVDSDKSPLQ